MWRTCRVRISDILRDSSLFPHVLVVYKSDCCVLVLQLEYLVATHCLLFHSFHSFPLITTHYHSFTPNLSSELRAPPCPISDLRSSKLRSCSKLKTSTISQALSIASPCLHPCHSELRTPRLRAPARSWHGPNSPATLTSPYHPPGQHCRAL